MPWFDTVAELAKSEAAERLVGGAGGAAMAAYWFPGGWIAKIMFGVVSLAASYHGSILLQHIFGGGSGLVGVFGWVSAVFGLTVVGRILRALAQTQFNRTQAAQLLGISFRQLRYQMQKLDIHAPEL